MQSKDTSQMTPMLKSVEIKKRLSSETKSNDYFSSLNKNFSNAKDENRLTIS